MAWRKIAGANPAAAAIIPAFRPCCQKKYKIKRKSTGSMFRRVITANPARDDAKMICQLLRVLPIANTIDHVNKKTTNTCE